MTIQQTCDLEREVLGILERAGEPLNISQIEKSLAVQFPVDTFDIRDAVWRLIAERRAEFTPRRYVKIAAQETTKACGPEGTLADGTEARGST